MSRRLGVWIALLLLAACRQEELPSLSSAMAATGEPAERSKAFAQVALRGHPEERERAAFLWGLHACEARSPLSAVTAFNLARPTGGRARLATRRLEEALTAAGAPVEQWFDAVGARWLEEGERSRLALRGAEAAMEAGNAEGALRLASSAAGVQEFDLARWLRIQILAAGDQAPVARRRLAVEHPHRWSRLLPGHDLDAVTAEFTQAEWQRHAAAWIDSGNPTQGLRAAARAGSERPFLSARALNRLRRPREALRWAEQVPVQRADGWLERGEALRQIAWGAAQAERPRRWLEVTRAGERAFALSAPGSAERNRAALLLGEALAERGQGRQAAQYLLLPGVPGMPRWEWVWRRGVFLEVQQGRPAHPPVELPGRSVRGQRLEAFWSAGQAAGAGESGRLQELAGSGYPDLPALWASSALGRQGVPFQLLDMPVETPGPPDTLSDLLTMGRVADVLVAWRAELESGLAPPQAWLGFVAMAGLRPAETVPLLIRAEPRLLTGPWEGLSRELLEQYLPLPYRQEVEEAAVEAHVPPWVLAGLVRQESAWNQRAVSPAGAVGLAQLMPATARDLVRRRRLPPQMGRTLTDPAGNLRIGALLLREWQQRLGGSMTVALAAYNGGERRARLFWDRAGRRDGPEFVEGIEVPETWDYVHRVVVLAEGYRVLYWPEGSPYPWQ